ncbi:helix-turn-helix domain-containing protein [Agromyces sp. MMS24-K17]|uniref:helix-turn-helix domain-containing protein n=1 Tax=Agromyces sp. MMS24-K17 TaxID=3372850 RepID=UPI00375501DF
MYTATITDATRFGLALQQARMAAGMSQRQLAERIGVSQRYVWELESGKDFPAIARLIDALTATGATITVAVPEGLTDAS